MDFDYPEDREFFSELLCNNDERRFASYLKLFDFRDLNIKRREFNRIKNEILQRLIQIYGTKCILHYDDQCLENDKNELHIEDLQVDHIIPLSSNKLNKAGSSGK